MNLQGLRPGRLVAEPFDGCLLQSAVPEEDPDDELESSIEHEDPDEISGDLPQQLQPMRRIGSICEEELGDDGQVAVALEEAKVVQLQRGLRRGIREDTGAIAKQRRQSPPQDAERPCISVSSKQRGGGGRSPISRRHANSLHCRSPRDRARRQRAAYGNSVARSAAQRLVRAEATTGRQRSGSF